MAFDYNFKWSILWQEPYGMWLVQGIGYTLLIGACAWVIAFILGVFIGTLRVTNLRLLRFIGTVYTEVFRNIPFIVQIFFWFYAAPMLFGPVLGPVINKIPNLSLYVAIIGLGLYTASRVAEHVRAGYASISRDQYQAALSTGMSQIQMYRYVIIPYCLRLIIPPITTEFLTIFKNTSIAMVISVPETTFMTYQIDAETFHGFEATTAAMVIYFFIGMAVVKIMDLVEGKFKIPGMTGRG
jgi:glutamate/aspartate transport system permease protein